MFGFVSRTLVLGAAAAVLRYNVFSRLLTSLVNRMFGIPPICFFDDFAALISRLLGSKAIQVCSFFCFLLGIQLGTNKSDVGGRITFLGLRGRFHSEKNGYTIHISPP